MGHQRHRPDALALRVNLTCNSWFCVSDQHLAKNCPLIIKFFMEFADILASQAFREWHDKYQENFPCLTHSCVVMVYEVIRVFGSITIDEFNQHALSRGDSLSASTHQPALDVMQQMITSLKSGRLQSSIGKFSSPTSSCSYFRNSIEGTPRVLLSQRTANSQVSTQRSNAPRENSSRNTQRTNVSNNPITPANDTGWITNAGRSSRIGLP